jgi:hypothetical protein
MKDIEAHVEKLRANAAETLRWSADQGQTGALHIFHCRLSIAELNGLDDNLLPAQGMRRSFL